jgi:hypothetical protein
LLIDVDKYYEFLISDSSWWDWKHFVPCLASH